jgi:hypothetical protein
LGVALRHPDDVSDVLALPRAKGIDVEARGIAYRHGKFLVRIKRGARGAERTVFREKFLRWEEAVDALKRWRAAQAEETAGVT